MGLNNENQWQCWMLETRPELPYRLDKQMYPLGMSLDLSSQMRIKQCKYIFSILFLNNLIKMKTVLQYLNQMKKYFLNHCQYYVYYQVMVYYLCIILKIS